MSNNHCPVCKSKVNAGSFQSEFSVSSDGIFRPFPVEVYPCDYCGNSYVAQTASLCGKMNEFYQHEYDFLLDCDEEEPYNIDDNKAVPYSECLVTFFAKYIDPEKHTKILDVGAGKGNFLAALHHQNPCIGKHAIEPSRSYSQLAKLPFIKSTHNDFFASSLYKGQNFDLLALIGVLEHVTSPVDFLRNVRDVLADKNSLVFIEVPNFKNNKTDLLTFDHLFKYTEKSFENVVKISGFAIVDQIVDPKRVPMQFVLKPGDNSTAAKFDVDAVFDEAKSYIDQIISDATAVHDNKIAVYGQSLILPYLLGTHDLKENNIVCVIDDNPVYQGRFFQEKVPIISLDDFIEQSFYAQVQALFLAMNDCYHRNVLEKLKLKELNFPVYGKWIRS